MPRAKPTSEVIEADPDEQLDQPTETDTLSGAIPEGEVALARSVASKMGWTPIEDWKRDPSKWVDAPEFLENTPKVIAELKERGERIDRAAAAAIEEVRQKKAEDAQRIIRESDDPDKREAAAKELRGPPPQTVAWIGRNPWFETDNDAKLIAANAIETAFKSGASIEAQLKAGEEAAKRVFPHYFSTGTEQRLSDVRRQAPTPPQVQEGSRASASQPKEKGFAQIPRADREAFQEHLLKPLMAHGRTREQAEEGYARRYWAAPPIDPSERPAEQFPLKPQPSRWAKKRAGR
jgi:hypothetical protein